MNTKVNHYVGDSCPGGHQEETAAGLTGIRADSGKLRYDLIPWWPLEQLARVYTMGAHKYGDDNYLGGMKWRRIVAAMFRHMEAWRAGEANDTESGVHHMAHVAWNAFTLMLYEIYELGEDDRWEPPEEETNDPTTQ